MQRSCWAYFERGRTILLTKRHLVPSYMTRLLANEVMGSFRFLKEECQILRLDLRWSNSSIGPNGRNFNRCLEHGTCFRQWHQRIPWRRNRSVFCLPFLFHLHHISKVIKTARSCLRLKSDAHLVTFFPFAASHSRHSFILQVNPCD